MRDYYDIGPETFGDGSTISHRGHNYYRACGHVVVQPASGGSTSCVKRQDHPSNVHEDYWGNVACGTIVVERAQIDEGEPLVLFKATDNCLPKVLTAYWRLCSMRNASSEYLNSVTETINRVKVWQAANGVTEPDSFGAVSSTLL